MGAAALPAALIGSSIVSGVMSPKPDELGTFADIYDADPRTWLGDAHNIMGPLLNSAIARAGEPVNLPEPKFQLPTFSGGGLPMPIGAQEPPKPQTGPRASSFFDPLDRPGYGGGPGQPQRVKPQSMFGSSTGSKSGDPRAAARLLLMSAGNGGGG